MRTVQGFVLVVPHENGEGRMMMIGPGGFLQDNGLMPFHSQAAARAAARTTQRSARYARFCLVIAENEEDLATLHQSQRLIVISWYRDRTRRSQDTLYEFYGPVTRGHAADMFDTASYLGTRGWRSFNSFQIADAAAREISRQSTCPATLAKFSLKML